MELVGNFKERLQESVNESGLSQAEIARNAHISRSLLNKYLSGASKAGNVPLYALAQALNVNVLWLMGYDVPKREDDEHKQLKKEITDRLANLSNEQLKKIKRFIDEFI